MPLQLMATQRPGPYRRSCKASLSGGLDEAIEDPLRPVLRLEIGPSMVGLCFFSRCEIGQTEPPRSPWRAASTLDRNTSRR
jgi:hypothetical protein